MIITPENPTQEHASGPWGLTRFLPKGFGACIYFASRLTKLDLYRANLNLLSVVLYLLCSCLLECVSSCVQIVGAGAVFYRVACLRSMSDIWYQ